MGEMPILAIVLAGLALAIATLVSEDLTCIGAGVLVADGQLPFALATTGCLVGIVAGDLLLMVAGRAIARRTLSTRIAARFVDAEGLKRASQWIERRGAFAVAASRFVPGTRLGTYLAAGALGLDARSFTVAVTATAAIWVPALVGISAVAGREAVEAGLLSASGIATRVGAAIALAAALVQLAKRQLTWKNRRRLHGLWMRWTRWEFWPMWLFYPPVIVYIAWLAVRHRSLTLFTAVNPGIPAGGFVGESKIDILRALSAVSDRVPHAMLVAADQSLEAKLAFVRAFMERHALTLPVVVKPDRGQRGSGVSIARSLEALRERLDGQKADVIVQEYVGGLEFGVFYYRLPSSPVGHIFSITEKRFPSVTGDGRRTLEELILDDERAVCMERVHRSVHRCRLQSIPAPGQSISLVEIGSHCRGAAFFDATCLATPAMEEAFDVVARGAGFYFGRFDVRTPSIEAFTERGEFQILELNGVTSEATNIYDPANSVWTAYRVLRAQWRLAFEIAADNRRRGARPTPLSTLLSLVRQQAAV